MDDKLCMCSKYMVNKFLSNAKIQSLYIRLHVCESVSESVCPSGHLVPGTNSKIEGLTFANSETNFISMWD